MWRWRLHPYAYQKDAYGAVRPVSTCTARWLSSLLGVMLLMPASVGARVINDGRGISAQVEICLSALQRTNIGRAVLMGLNGPDARWNVFIRPSYSPASWARPQVMVDAADPRQGSSTFIYWQPFPILRNYCDGTPREACSSLLHELWHALDNDRGAYDYSPIAPGIDAAQIPASQAQNTYLREIGGIPRQFYGSGCNGRGLVLGIAIPLGPPSFPPAPPRGGSTPPGGSPAPEDLLPCFCDCWVICRK
jgi:hypothetical protein